MTIYGLRRETKTHDLRKYEFYVALWSLKELEQVVIGCSGEIVVPLCSDSL